MIDYHRKKDFSTIEIGTRLYAHDSGFAGNVVQVFLEDPKFKDNKDTILLEISEKAYGDHKHYKRFMLLQEEDVFHVCDTRKELTPKPIEEKTYRLEDVEVPSGVGLIK